MIGVSDFSPATAPPVLVLFGHGIVPFGHRVVLFGHCIVLFGHRIVLFGHHIVILGHCMLCFMLDCILAAGFSKGEVHSHTEAELGGSFRRSLPAVSVSRLGVC